MSEADTQLTATLLPGASVAVYSTDRETLESARLISDDWRFARVAVYVEEGDVGSAIAKYADAVSPNLIIIQTDTIDDGFTDKLDDLAENCAEGTNAIVIGPVNDVYLYRKLIDMGVSDYLVKPLDTAMLSEVIAKTLVDQIGVAGSRLVACIGAKGGVGTSSVLEALSLASAELLGQKTIVVDPSGGWSTHPVGIGYEPSSTLSEAARAASNDDEEGLKRLIHKVSDKMMVLSSGGEVMLDQPIDKAGMEVLLDTLMARYPVVYVDLSTCDTEIKKIVCARANKIVMCSSAVLPSLRLARTLLQELKDLRGGSGDDVHVVINMQGLSPNNEMKKADIEKALEISPSLYLPFDPKTFISVECADQNFASDKDGIILLKNQIVPFLKNVLRIGNSGQEAAVKDAGDKNAGLLGGLLGKLGSKS